MPPNKIFSKRPQPGLEQELSRLKNELSDRDRIIEDLRKELELYQSIGPDTRGMNNINNIYRYKELLEKQPGNDEIRAKLKIQLQMVFQDSYAKKRYGVKYKGTKRAMYSIADSLNEIFEKYDDSVTDIILLVEHTCAEDALVPSRVYSQAKNDILKGVAVPSIPETLQISQFIIVQEIIGPDTFSFFPEQVARASLPQDYKSRLEYLVTKKHLDDVSYFMGTDFGFILEPSRCEEKLVDTLKKYTRMDSYSEESIRDAGRLLDRISACPFPDVTRWNTKMPAETARLLLEKEWADEEITRILDNRGLFHIDLYNLRKKTFVFDDYVQIVDSYGSNLAPEQRKKLLDHFVTLVSPVFRDAEEKLEYLPLWRGYRNLRSFYWQDVGKLPGPREECKAHYLTNSYVGFYTFAHKTAPAPESLASVNPDKVLQSILAAQQALAI